MQNIPFILDKHTQTISVERGLSLYRERLRPILEPEFIGQIVVIHLDSEDYEVGKNSTQATRLLRLRHPDGLTISLDIGSVPMDDPLSLRMRGETTTGGKP